MNIHTLSQKNGFILFINYKNIDDIGINGDLKNGDVICGNGFINRQTLSKCNESSYFNEMDVDVENGYASVGNCFMNIHTISEANSPSSIDSKK